MALSVQEHVPLAPRTTLELGGPARYLVEVSDEPALLKAFHWAKARSLPTFLLGGGSNLLVSDQGFNGLVIDLRISGCAFEGRYATAGAGHSWDGLVAEAVERGLCGLECLSGIPGRAGATPVQNVGAYGQEVAQRLQSIVAFDPVTELFTELAASELGFSYRQSVLQARAKHLVVVSLRFALDDKPRVPSYPELVSELAGKTGVEAIRQAVLHVRARKSMLLDPHDENRRSAGSFFLNPIVDRELAEALADKLPGLPQYATRDPATVKLSAAFLLERAGFVKGFRRQHFGVSTRHSLAIVHLGGGTTSELIAFAKHLRSGVFETFGVQLSPEPVRVGFESDPFHES